MQDGASSPSIAARRQCMLELGGEKDLPQAEEGGGEGGGGAGVNAASAVFFRGHDLRPPPSGDDDTEQCYRCT